MLIFAGSLADAEWVLNERRRRGIRQRWDVPADFEGQLRAAQGRYYEAIALMEPLQSIDCVRFFVVDWDREQSSASDNDRELLDCLHLVERIAGCKAVAPRISTAPRHAAGQSGVRRLSNFGQDTQNTAGSEMDRHAVRLGRLLPDHLHHARSPDIGVACDERQLEIDGGRTNQRIEWIPIDAGFVGDEDLRRGQVVRLVGGVAEQIVEKASHRAAQIDAPSPPAWKSSACVSQTAAGRSATPLPRRRVAPSWFLSRHGPSNRFVELRPNERVGAFEIRIVGGQVDRPPHRTD
jgi:hypothetical protein